LQRSDAGTVFASLPFRIGDTYNDEKGAAALRALFATGRSRTCGSRSMATWWW
jgi:outer membrane protein insertion porin family